MKKIVISVLLYTLYPMLILYAFDVDITLKHFIIIITVAVLFNVTGLQKVFERLHKNIKNDNKDPE